MTSTDLSEATPVPQAPEMLDTTEPAREVRATFISARVVAGAWFVALVMAGIFSPAVTEAVQPTLFLTIVSNVAAVVWLATLVGGAVRLGATAALGLVTGGFMLVGHLVCGVEGHVPMTSAIWIAQLMLVAGATAISALALATRR